MWYTGYDGANYALLYATSPDGLTWTKLDNTTPAVSDSTSTNGRIGYGSNGKGDDVAVYYPTPIKEGSLYKIWYSGYDGSPVQMFYATLETGLTASSTIDSGWNHITAVIDGTDVHIYINGVLDDSGTTAVTGITNTGSLVLGDQFDGNLDEVAIYDRVLSATEILDNYKRGAVRLKYHVRSCNDAACSGEGWIGPDGTSGTYYSELSNSTLVQPSLTLTNVTDNQYFQYKAFFESDSTSYSPELKSATVDYTVLNASPNTPTNSSPADAAVGQQSTVTLTSSAFSDSDGGDTHLASQWQVSITSGDYGTPLYDSSTDTTNLTSLLLPATTLSNNTTYYWHVRHQDNNSAWSSYSTETEFTVSAKSASLESVINPTIIINEGALCTSDPRVLLTLNADNAQDVLISDSEFSTGAEWIPYASQVYFTFTDTTLEDKTVYVKYRSSTLNQSTQVNDSISLESAESCGDAPLEIIEDIEDLADIEPIVEVVIVKTTADSLAELEQIVNEIRTIHPDLYSQLLAMEVEIDNIRSKDDSLHSVISDISVGDYVQGESSNTIFAVDEDDLGNLVKHPVINLLTYYTRFSIPLRRAVIWNTVKSRASATSLAGFGFLGYALMRLIALQTL